MWHVITLFAYCAALLLHSLMGQAHASSSKQQHTAHTVSAIPATTTLMLTQTEDSKGTTAFCTARSLVLLLRAPCCQPTSGFSVSDGAVGQFDMSDASCCGASGSSVATHNELKKRRVSRHLLQEAGPIAELALPGRHVLQTNNGCAAPAGPANGEQWLLVSCPACLHGCCDSPCSMQHFKRSHNPLCCMY